MLMSRCRRLSCVCWVDLLALLEYMLFQGNDGVLYSLYSCALNNIQLILVHIAQCCTFVLLNFFDIFLAMLGEENFFEDRPLDIGIDDI